MSICIQLHYCFKCLIWSKSEDISTFCCILTYLNNALLITPINRPTVLKSPRGKRSASAILIRNNCYFNCSFCWLGLHVRTGLISHIPPLIFGFIVMGYFLFFSFIFFPPFLLYWCLYRKACFKAYYCISKIFVKLLTIKNYPLNSTSRLRPVSFVKLFFIIVRYSLTAIYKATSV